MTPEDAFKNMYPAVWLAMFYQAGKRGDPMPAVDMYDKGAIEAAKMSYERGQADKEQ